MTCEPVAPALAPSRAGAWSTTVGAAVAGLGTVVPEQVVSSESLARRLGVDTEWIVSRTGILQRPVAGADELLSDYAATAAAMALRDAGVAGAEVDLVLVATVTADEQMPAAAPLVAQALGAVRAGAMDVGAACSGFVSALALGASAIESGRARVVVVVGADFMTRMTDPDDRVVAPLFADGAGAVVLVGRPAPTSVGPVVLGCDGAGAGLLHTPRCTGNVEMDGPEVFKHAVTRMAQVTRDACTAAGVGLGDIDLFVYHQANRRILATVGKRLALPVDRVVDCVASYGNTSAASIPLALADAGADGRLRAGSRVLLACFGAGFTWAGAVLDWQAAPAPRAR